MSLIRSVKRNILLKSLLVSNVYTYLIFAQTRALSKLFRLLLFFFFFLLFFWGGGGRGELAGWFVRSFLRSLVIVVVFVVVIEMVWYPTN